MANASEHKASYPAQKFGLQKRLEQSKEDLSNRWEVDSIDSLDAHWEAVLWGAGNNNEGNMLYIYSC